MKLSQLIIILILFILTVLLRSHSLSETYSFNAEYNYKLWPVKEIVYDGKLRLIGIEAVSYIHHLHYPPLALYLFSPILYLSGSNPISIEIALILLSGVTAVLLFFLGKRLIGTHEGIIMSLMYAFSFFIQRNDRFIWVIGTIIFITTLYLLLFHKMINAKKVSRVQPLLIGIVVGLGLNFHYQATILLVATLIFFFLNDSTKKAFANSLFFLVGVVIPISPLIVFELRHSFYNINGVLILFQDSGGIFTSSFSETMIKSFQAVFLLPLNIFGINVESNYFLYAVALFVPIQLLTIGVLHSFRKRYSRLSSQFLQLCFILWLIGIISFPFVQNTHYSVNYYLLYLIPVILIATGLLLSTIWGQLKRFRIVLIIVVLLFVAVNIRSNVNFENKLAWKNQIEAVDFIISEAPNRDFEIKFLNTQSEEFDYLFYYLSLKKSYPYANIHYIEMWHNDDEADFALAINKKIDKAVSFGPISIVKKYEGTEN